mmetsp:Transcript_46474/g.89696  ORF Transcript_46474/g.89696 Transcript_46474/m.89696 type:complete len:261 (+) Transcript_46474:22-804(+)
MLQPPATAWPKLAAEPILQRPRLLGTKPQLVSLCFPKPQLTRCQAWSAMEILRQADEGITARLQRLSFGVLDYVVLPAAVLFGWSGIGPVLVAVFLLAGLQGLFLAVLALAVGQVACRGLKVLLQRRRPSPPAGVSRAITIKVPGPDDPDGASFPSGDTMAASAVGAALALAGHGAPWWLLGAYAGFARVYFWCHFAFDTFMGYIVGSAAALLVSSISNGGLSLKWHHVALAVPPFLVVMKVLKKLQAARHAKGNQKTSN